MGIIRMLSLQNISKYFKDWYVNFHIFHFGTVLKYCHLQLMWMIWSLTADCI